MVQIKTSKQRLNALNHNTLRKRDNWIGVDLENYNEKSMFKNLKNKRCILFSTHMLVFWGQLALNNKTD